MPIPESAQKIDTVVDNLITACASIYGLTLDVPSGEYTGSWNDGIAARQAVLVEGGPGSYLPDLVIAVASDIRQPIERPTMTTNRSREIEAQIDVTFSVVIAGNSTAAATARRCVNAAAEALSLYFRQSGNETLGNACREALVTDIQGPTPSLVMTEEGVYGRNAHLVATVTAYIRN